MAAPPSVLFDRRRGHPIVSHRLCIPANGWRTPALRRPLPVLASLRTPAQLKRRCEQPRSVDDEKRLNTMAGRWTILTRVEKSRSVIVRLEASRKKLSIFGWAGFV